MRSKSPVGGGGGIEDQCRMMMMNGSDLDHRRTSETLNEMKQHENCDSGWGLQTNNSIKDYNKADLFEEDDLGFDPFHETQKALAEMLESESKAAQQQQQQQRHLYQHQQSAPPFTTHRHNNESPPLLRQQSPVMNRAPGVGGGGQNFRGFAEHTSNTAVQQARVKQPPPGFDPLSMLNTAAGTNGQPSTQRNLLSPGTF